MQLTIRILVHKLIFNKQKFFKVIAHSIIYKGFPLYFDGSLNLY